MTRVLEALGHEAPLGLAEPRLPCLWKVAHMWMVQVGRPRVRQVPAWAPPPALLSVPTASLVPGLQPSGAPGEEQMTRG